MQKRLVMFAVVLTSIGAFTAPVVVSLGAQAPAQQAASRAERTVWYFYRVKWGFQDEFVALFARNHLPVLKEEVKSGHLKDVRTTVAERLRSGEVVLHRSQDWWDGSAPLREKSLANPPELQLKAEVPAAGS